MFSASVTSSANGVNTYGVVVTASGSATATSDISESDALLKATLIAQNVANSQLQNDINIIDQSVDTAISFGVTGPTGKQGPKGTSLWQQNGSSIYYGAGNVGIEGKLGIGITDPTVALDVVGSLKTTSDATINGLTIGSGGGNLDSNTALGASSLYTNSTGVNNTALGASSLYTNSTGANNTANGTDSLANNTTGANNTASGYQSLYSNTTGANNTANGVYSLESNTTGNYNTASGVNSLFTNSTGNYNTASGYQSLYSNTTNNHNTASGSLSLYTNTDGGNNTASGYQALQSNTTGSNNTASGAQSLYSNSTGSNNTAIGSGSLYSNTTGTNNTAFGINSLQSNKTGSNNTAIGFLSNVSDITFTNCTSIGNGAWCTANNQITLGDTSITSLRCHKIYITSLSDQRDKKDIETLESSLAFVGKLKPVRFNWNMRDGGKVDIPEIGFIAQDLQQVQLDTGMKIPDLVYDENPEKLEASYDTLLPLLVKSIQELSQEIKYLKQEMSDLKNK